MTPSRLTRRAAVPCVYSHSRERHSGASPFTLYRASVAGDRELFNERITLWLPS